MSINRKLCQRIAEESQLLMEQKWIKEALATIKAQRNCLQVERLVLESMKSQEKKGMPSQFNTMPSVEHTIQFEVTPRLDCDEENCNNEELNLDISNMFSNINPHTPFMEEEDDEDNPNNVLIDVDMLMNGNQ